MSQKAPADFLSRFLFQDYPVRFMHVSLSKTWRHIRQNGLYPCAIERLLGELAAAATLLAANLKFAGSLTLQIQSPKGLLRMMVAEAHSNRTCRATLRYDEKSKIDENATLQDLVGTDAVFTLTLQQTGGKMWQGLVPIEGVSVSQMLMNYMQLSEQLQTYIALFANENGAAGLLLQRLPENDFQGEAAEEFWSTTCMLTKTATADDLLNLSGADLARRLFHNTAAFDHLSDEEVEFFCTCSHEKVGDMLRFLGEEEVRATLQEQGIIDVACEYCKQRYVFDHEDVYRLFAGRIDNPRVH